MTLPISRHLHSRDPQPNPTVAHVQSRAIGKGYSVGVHGADGIYGYDTEAAIVRFQHHIGLTADGVVGSKTLAALDATVAAHSIDSGRFADLMYGRMTGSDGHPRPRYVFGAEIADLSARWPDKCDCSEAVQWGVFQIAHTTWVDGSWNQAHGCKIISVDQAASTKGALLFVSSNGTPSGVHHVACSMGRGRSHPQGTAEARNSTRGCGSWAIGNRFSFGGLPTILHY